MTLGERITYYRNRAGLSQGELAERMGVSRQAVSKWETDGSLPDLDRLIALAELFGTSLDTLVRGEAAASPAAPGVPPAPAPHPASPAAAPAPRSATQRTVGFILLTVGLLAVILGLCFSPAIIVLALPLILFAVICLVMRRDAGYVIFGIIVGAWFFGARFVFGFSPGGIFNPWVYSAEFWNRTMAINVILSAACWICSLVYLWLLLRRFGKQRYTLLIFGWMILLFGLRGHLFNLWRYAPSDLQNGYFPMAIAANLFAAVLLFFTVRCLLHTRKKPE